MITSKKITTAEKFGLPRKSLRKAKNFFTSQHRTPVTLSINYFVDYKFCSHFKNDETAINHIDVIHGQVN